MNYNYKILKNLNTPNDIKKLTLNELNELAKEVRDFIIYTTSENGGHLASSLGAVELTIALLYCFDFKNDKIIWDVGHQTYAYKILTDRKNKFHTLRQFNGVSGFPKRKESIYDSFDTGHSSTSISAGMGMCVARDNNNENFNVISVIGDGAMTGGMAFEALNNLSELNSKMIVILNDNEMSISKSKGGLNKALLGLRSSSSYTESKKNLKKVLEKSNIGIFIKEILITLVNIIKEIFIREGMLFENLNINYVGPIDGHNIKNMISIFDKAKNNNEPILIHIKTLKGKGYKPAEENPTFYHGIEPFNVDTGEIKNKTNKKTYTNFFSESVLELSNKNIVAITAAMKDGVGLKFFAEKYPNKFYDVGICEQHAVTFAAGMATLNIIPIVCIYSSFLQRAFDQIIHDVCLQNLHVIFAIDRAGIVGADGETHQGLFDISFLRLIPNITIMAPKNGNELKQMINFSVNKISTPIAIRYPRGIAYDELNEFDSEIILGKSEILYDEGDISLFALGSMVKTAIEVRNKLKNMNIDSRIINARFAKPIDYFMIDTICKKSKIVLILEEGIKTGGIGEEIENYINTKNYDTKVILISIDDTFIPQGNVNELKTYFKIDSDSIVKKILEYN